MFNAAQQRSYDQLYEALHAHHYYIAADPIDGMEEEFLADLREGLSKIERCIAVNAKRYGFRGLSRNALDALHTDLPVPCFNAASAHAKCKP